MAAGSKRVVELHGSIHQVECMDCNARQHREELQQRLRWLNSATWDAVALGVSHACRGGPGCACLALRLMPGARPAGTQNGGERLYRPDGDVDLSPDACVCTYRALRHAQGCSHAWLCGVGCAAARYKTFNVADCSVCGGVLKPAVVFFGGSIPAGVVQESLALVNECDAVLAVGTTMMVRERLRQACRPTQVGCSHESVLAISHGGAWPRRCFPCFAWLGRRAPRASRWASSTTARHAWGTSWALPQALMGSRSPQQRRRRQ